MICLDTNIVIAHMRGSRPDIRERLASEFRSGRTIYLPVIVLMELYYGVARASHPERVKTSLNGFLNSPIQILEFTNGDAERTGVIRADLSRRGLTIGPFDVLIAAQAVERNLTLITNNTREFSRVEGLKFEDWL
jgi:tRNA(fMet)-specific endonuclease VapC